MCGRTCKSKSRGVATANLSEGVKLLMEKRWWDLWSTFQAKMAVGFDLEAVLFICQLDGGRGMIFFTTKLLRVNFLTIQRSHSTRQILERRRCRKDYAKKQDRKVGVI